MAMLPMMLLGCGDLVNETAVTDRVRPMAADCASALAGEDIAAMRRACRGMLATLEAGAGWSGQVDVR
jgi:hypothetical protein